MQLQENVPSAEVYLYIKNLMKKFNVYWKVCFFDKFLFFPPSSSLIFVYS